MQPNEQFKGVLKIMIFAFLCTEMQTTFTHRELAKQKRGIGTSAAAAAGQRQLSPAPYQASIRLTAQEVDYFGKGHICSGALVGPSVVLTLGHCLYNNDSQSFYHPAELRVVLGTTQRFAPSTYGQIYGVTHIYQPPKHLSLAILMLEHDVPADQTSIQPISLPLAIASFDEQDTELCHISSWGLAGDDGQELHDMLTLGVTRLKCTGSQHEICVAYDEHVHHADYELDEGAPLIKANQLLGLRGKTTNFVDVASHVDWIKAQTGNGVNQNSSIWGILGLLVFTVYVIMCSRKSILV